MRPNKKLSIVFIISFLLLCGCAQGDLHVTVNKDGSGIYKWKILTDAFAQKYLQQITTLYSHKGYETKLIRENGQIGFIATKPVKNIAKEPLTREINAAIPTDFSSTMREKPVISSDIATNQTPSLPKELTIKSSFWKTALLFQTQVNMKQNIDNLAGPYANYVSGLLNRLTFRFHLTLPIAPTKQNASIVSRDGKTLTWNLKLGQSNPIEVGTDVSTPIILFLAAVYDQTKYVPQFWPLTIQWIIVILFSFTLLFFLSWYVLRKMIRR